MWGSCAPIDTQSIDEYTHMYNIFKLSVITYNQNVATKWVQSNFVGVNSQGSSHFSHEKSHINLLIFECFKYDWILVPLQKYM